MKWTILTAMLICLGLCGCASPKYVADQTVNMSLAIEDATNRMLLLNIVRAYHQMPLQFAKINKVSGPAGIGGMTQTLTPKLSSLFAATAFDMTSSFKPDQPAFDLTPIDSQQFYQGITAPITPQLFGYYLDQGWPKSLLFSMFVHEVEKSVINEQGEETSTMIYTNSPRSTQVMTAFQEFVDSLDHCNVQFETEPAPKNFGPPIQIDADFPIDKLAAVAAAGLQINSLPDGRFQLQKPGKNDTLTVKALPLQLGHASPSPACKFLSDAPRATETSRSLINLRVSRRIAGESKDQHSTAHYSLTLRSPAAMIYYLGEVARAHIEKNDPSTIPIAPSESKRLAHLFALEINSSSEPRIAVEFAGDTYLIPKSNGHKSLQVLTLISQLIALQNSATAAPVTSSVRLSN